MILLTPTLLIPPHPHPQMMKTRHHHVGEAEIYQALLIEEEWITGCLQGEETDLGHLIREDSCHLPDVAHLALGRTEIGIPLPHNVEGIVHLPTFVEDLHHCLLTGALPDSDHQGDMRILDDLTLGDSEILDHLGDQEMQDEAQGHL